MPSEARSVELKFGEITARATIEDLDGFPSRFSGKNLRRAKATISAEDEEESQTHVIAARSSKTLVETADGFVWEIVSSSLEFTDQGPSAQLDLQEYEPILATEVIFPDFTLKPTAYNEDVYGEMLIVQILAKNLKSETFQQIRALRDTQYGEEFDYFEVTRRGVSDEPLSVRFGRVLWQVSDDGRTYLITLVSERGDNDDAMIGPPQPWEPALNRIIDFGANARLRLMRIEQLLISAGIADSSIAEELDEFDPKILVSRDEFNRVRRGIERFM